MKQRFVRNVVALSAIIAGMDMALQNAAAANYKIDPAHSQVGFKVKHLGVSSVHGIFKDFEGTFSFDPSNIPASSAKATIKTASVNTEVEKRDTHLRNDDFLLAKDHPDMLFVSKEIKDVKGDTFTIVGELTIRGVTKPVELKTTYNGSVKDPQGTERAGFTAETVINRKEFGVKFNAMLETGGLVVGDEVKIQIELEGTKLPA